MRTLWLGFGILLSLFSALQPAVAQQPRKFAFLVGISSYPETQLKPLPYARADILEFRDLLLESGYEVNNVVMMVDDVRALPLSDKTGRYLPEHRKIRTELEILIRQLEEDDQLVIAMCGHGIQFLGDSAPYFCPLDANLADRSTLISMNWVYEQLQPWNETTRRGCKARARLLIMDACRKDPESTLLRDKDTVDLEPLKLQLAKPPEGLVALFSCEEGQSALEHDELRHGVFFYHVLEGLRGRADGDQNQQVTLDEMVAFCKTSTADYARRKLTAAQNPRQQGFFDGTWILKELKRSQTFVESLGMQFVDIPAGEFVMGSDETKEDLEQAGFVIPDDVDLNDESPVHRVQLSKFRMLTTEVTRGMFGAFVKATGYRTDAEKDGKGGWGYNPQTKFGEQDSRFSWRNTGFSQSDNHPVVNVSWNDADAFCRWVTSESEKRGEKVRCRLPTEAQWEYAARAGTRTRFATGDNPLSLRGAANVMDASFETAFPGVDYEQFQTFGFNDGAAFTSVVGRYQKNAFGLYDMHGNVWEWCRDWYDSEYYKNSPATDPQGPSSGSSRVLRGGSWPDGPFLFRCALRYYYTPDYRFYNSGFRLVLE
jgi:formylglycine-generating enzyme required for sulfatase activity